MGDDFIRPKLAQDFGLRDATNGLSFMLLDNAFLQKYSRPTGMFSCSLIVSTRLPFQTVSIKQHTCQAVKIKLGWI